MLKNNLISIGWQAGNENKSRTTQKSDCPALQTMRVWTEKHKATCWRVRTIRGCHKTEAGKKKQIPSVTVPSYTWCHKTYTLPRCFFSNLHPTKIWNKRKQSSDCFPGIIAWHRVHGQNHANIHLFGVTGTETGQGETMAKCLCYWITKADSWLFAFTRSHSALVAKWWNPHRYKGHCYKRQRLSVCLRAGDTAAFLCPLKDFYGLCYSHSSHAYWLKIILIFLPPEDCF